jgi:ribosomal protein S18 acetylase RimI-like enzyme
MEFKNFDLNHDDLNKVVELIIETEPSFFYLLFGNKKDKSKSRLKNIVKAGKNSFGHEFIRLTIEKNKILGITTFYMANEIDEKMESEKYSKALDFLGLLRLNFFVKTLINKVLTTKLKDKELYIGNICVDKNFQGRGVGKFLLDNITSYAKKNNCKKIILDVSKENKIAIGLYKKMGFKITRERSSFLWKISIYQMIKEI